MMLEQPELELIYKGHTSQRIFHQNRLRYEWRAALGGTGSGKTFVGAAELACLCIDYPGLETVAFSPTFPMVKRNVLPVLRTLLGGSIENSPFIDKFHKGDMVIYWRNKNDPTKPGSTTWLNSLEYPERAEGQSLDVVWVDEARLVRHLELALLVIQRRLRGSPAGRALNFRPIGYLTTTPDYPGSQLHAFCEDPETMHPSMRVVRMPLMDNIQNLPQNYVDNIIRAHTGGLAEQFIYGRFAMVEMGSFAFDYTVHVVQDTDYDLSLMRHSCRLRRRQPSLRHR
jgi:phage terminase large subunit-like protein